MVKNYIIGVLIVLIVAFAFMHYDYPKIQAENALLKADNEQLTQKLEAVSAGNISLKEELDVLQSGKQTTESAKESLTRHNALLLRQLHAVNIDFGIGPPSPRSGPDDFWNTASGGNRLEETTVKALKTSKGQPIPIEAILLNLGGGWGNTGMGVNDPMLESFNYPLNNRGGDSHVVLRKVPPGTYDLYIYGHGAEPLYYGDYEVIAGDKNYGRKQTSDQMDAVTNMEWVEGSQYVVFRDIAVREKENLEIRIRPNRASPSDAMISGLQLVPAFKQDKVHLGQEKIDASLQEYDDPRGVVTDDGEKSPIFDRLFAIGYGKIEDGTPYPVAVGASFKTGSKRSVSGTLNFKIVNKTEDGLVPAGFTVTPETVPFENAWYEGELLISGSFDEHPELAIEVEYIPDTISGISEAGLDKAVFKTRVIIPE